MGKQENIQLENIVNDIYAWSKKFKHCFFNYTRRRDNDPANVLAMLRDQNVIFHPSKSSPLLLLYNLYDDDKGRVFFNSLVRFRAS